MRFECLEKRHKTSGGKWVSIGDDLYLSYIARASLVPRLKVECLECLGARHKPNGGKSGSINDHWYHAWYHIYYMVPHVPHFVVPNITLVKRVQNVFKVAQQ